MQIKRQFIFRAALVVSGFLVAVFSTASLQATYEELIYSNDFSADTVGEKPGGFDYLQPISDNVGETNSLPISWSISGPIGALVVGPSTSPVSSLPGEGNKSLRLYDYRGDGDGANNARTYLGKTFVPDSDNERADVRIDFTFERSIFMDKFESGDHLRVVLGPYDEGKSFTSPSARAVVFAIANDGTYHPEGEDVVGDYGEGGEFSLFANAHLVPLDYDGPEGANTLEGYTYSVYLDGVRVVDGQEFNNNLSLGKFGLLTGTSDSAGEIDFVVDDLRISALREGIPDLPPPPPFHGWVEDFEDLEVNGEQPERPFMYTRPETGNFGQTAPLPITAGPQDQEPPAGVMVVDANSSPVPSFNGKSVRLYDYSAGLPNGRVHLEQNFIEDPLDAFPTIRFDFSFQRSLALPYPIEDGDIGSGGQAGPELTGMQAGLGPFADGMSLSQGADRMAMVQLRNDGTMRVEGDDPADRYQFEEYDVIGTHRISMFANCQEDSVEYEGPDGSTRTLDGFRFTVFLNGEIPTDPDTGAELEGWENRAYRSGIPENLGKYGFGTFINSRLTDLDFLFDDIEVTDFMRGDGEGLPPLRISQGETEGTVVLSWPGEDGISYRLRVSSDLLSWTDVEPDFVGSGETIEHIVDTDGFARRFFELTTVSD